MHRLHLARGQATAVGQILSQVSPGSLEVDDQMSEGDNHYCESTSR
jgi:hypothetical protein